MLARAADDALARRRAASRRSAIGRRVLLRPADAPGRRPPGSAPRSGACTAGSWRCSHVRGAPGRRAGPRRPRAGGSRTSGAACGRDAVAEPARRCGRGLDDGQACWRPSRGRAGSRTAGSRSRVPVAPGGEPRRARPREYRPSHSSATSPTGTTRSLSPLPMTRTKPPSSETSLPVEAERLAETRSPAAYRSSSSARSRRRIPSASVGCRSSGLAGGLEQPLDLGHRQRLGQQARLAAAGRGAPRRRTPMSPSPKANR